MYAKASKVYVQLGFSNVWTFRPLRCMDILGLYGVCTPRPTGPWAFPVYVHRFRSSVNKGDMYGGSSPGTPSGMLSSHSL